MPVQNSDEWPVAAVDWIDAHGLYGRFFAIPDFGSYIGWRLGNRANVYVDTRGFFFPPELIEDSHYVPQLGPGWERGLQRVLDHGTDYFLLETDGARGRLWQACSPYINEPLYRDDRTVLLSREQVSQALQRISESHQLAHATR